jgi:hypothetical protein
MGAQRQPQDIYAHALVESALLHVLVLDDFIRLGPRTRVDDAIALDFTGHGKPQGVLTPKSARC